MVGVDNPNWTGGKKLWIARQNHRRKQLGSNFLNKPFEGSVGHHITKNDVLYIPEEPHTSLHHSHNEPESMLKMNSLAFAFWEASVL